MEDFRTITVSNYDEALSVVGSLLLFSEVLQLIRDGKQGADDFLKVYIKGKDQSILFTRYEVVVKKPQSEFRKGLLFFFA